MKHLLLAITLTLSANSFAECTAPAPEAASSCSKLAAFQGLQDRKVLLSKYGYGLIKRDQYEALNKASYDAEKTAIARCVSAK